MVLPRRLLGLDRSGPEPPETRAGQPLRPLTLPNAVGYARLALLAPFLYLALGSGDGRSAQAAVLYAAIAGADYLDGLLARATGQYSRLGALLDPTVDRLAVLAGVAVCWRFELLPRWALAALAAREALTAALTWLALRRGLDIEINWLGRLAVWPAMGAAFLAMAVEGWVAEALLYLGLAMAVAATAAYIRDGLRRAASAASAEPSSPT